MLLPYCSRPSRIPAVAWLLMLRVPKHDGYPKPLPDLTFKAPHRTMQLYNLLAKCQSESRSAFLSGTRFIHHIKGFCDPRQLILWDPAPFICHKNQLAVLPLVSGEPDAFSRIGRFARIVHQI